MDAAGAPKPPGAEVNGVALADDAAALCPNVNIGGVEALAAASKLYPADAEIVEEAAGVEELVFDTPNTNGDDAGTEGAFEVVGSVESAVLKAGVADRGAGCEVSRMDTSRLRYKTTSSQEKGCL